MATVTLTLDKAAPNHGDTVTATYVVTGNDGTPAGPAQAAELSGDVTVGTETVHVSTVLTIPGTPAVPPLAETFTVPVVAGLTFKAVSGDPRKFTALVP